MSNLKLGSLFDGSGGFPLGAVLSGITPVWASEVEPYPIRVTTKRFPGMKHLGDISKLNGGDIEPVDIITFGSPCQDLSIAGKREGLDGSRSGLFYEAVRVVREMREATDGLYPRFIVWENVVGAFSSNKGEDFRTVIEEICNVKYDRVHIPGTEKWSRCGLIVEDDFSLAWRVFDAQYWGVPQRRRRIYLVADFRGQCAGKILFESEGLSRDTEAVEGERKGTSDGVERSTGETEQSRLMFACHAQDSRYNGPLTVADTVTQRYGTGGGNQPIILTPSTFDVRFTSLNTRNIRANCYETEISRCLDSGGANPDSNHGGVAVIQPSYGISRTAVNQGYDSRFSFQIEKEKAQTLLSTGPGAVGVHYSASKNSYFTKGVKEKTEPLVATDYKDPPIVNDGEPDRYIVRRLTPTECARLQGFPDWWTKDLGTETPTEEEIHFWRCVFLEHARVNGKKETPKSDSQIIKWLKNPESDSAEYRMWGNGVALPCVRYILSGIVHWENKGEENNGI